MWCMEKSSLTKLARYAQKYDMPMLMQPVYRKYLVVKHSSSNNVTVAEYN